MVMFLIAVDLGFLRDFGGDSYSVIKNLYCVAIEQKTYAHISPESVYSSSGDYTGIYQCGDEYDKKHPAG